MNKLVVFNAVAGAALIASAASAGVSTFGGALSPAVAIPDGIPGGGDGTPITLTISVPDQGFIKDINVTMGLNHTWFGDLNISLTKGGTTVVFSNGTPDDSSDLIGLYTMDDEAATTWDAAASAAGASIAPGSYRPDQALSAFDGINMRGVWTLTIVDTFGADIGSINHFSLTIDWNPIPAPGALAMLGLAGLAGTRRRRIA